MNSTANGRISCERDSSFNSYLDEEVERWQNRLHEVTMLNCNMMIRSLRCMMVETREMPTYDGVMVVDEFLDKFEGALME